MKRTVVFAAIVLFAAIAMARPPMKGEGKYVLFPATMPPTFGDSTHHFDVRFYNISLNLPMSNAGYTGRVQMDLTPRHGAFDTFSLNMVTLVCDSVRRAGNVCTFTTPTDRLLITLDRTFANGESLSVDIYFHKASGTEQRGFYWYPANQTNGHHQLAYTTTEPQDSRYWMPCFDEPWDKAERGCRMDVTVPDSLSDAGNGLLDSVTANTGAHTKTYWWTQRYPISTYLITLGVSKWSTTRQWFHLSPTESTYIQNYYWPEDSIDAISAFSHNVDMMDFFSDSLRYGRFPFEKYGMVEAYPFQWGGMENQTMTTIHGYWVWYGDDNGIAHEMSHQWWGDMVTCQDWRNIWLNEGSATFSDEEYDYHENGRASFMSLIASRANDYFDEEASDPRPVYAPPIDNLFTWGHTYVKGAAVHHMLRYVEGDTNWAQPGIFYRALRAYGDTFKYGNANTDDYCRIHEQMTGLELSWFFDEWIYQMGYPTYDIGWSGRQTVDGWEVVLDVEQNNGSGFPALFHMPVEIKVNWSGGSQTFRFDVNANPQRAVFSVPAQPTGIVFDPNDWILEQHSTRVGVAEGTVPAGTVRARLETVSPSPARTSVRFGYVLPKTENASLGIYDQTGRLVRQLVASTMSSGRHSLTWDRTDARGRRVAAGVYVVRFAAGVDTESRQLVITD